MNAFKLEQYRMTLEVLEQMKDCLDRGETYTTVKGKPFNVTRQFGICWHVYAHTPNQNVTGIGTDFMCPAFADMGLDIAYPVECQTTGSRDQMRQAFSVQRNMYDDNTIHGANRIKLVDSLIQYYREKMETPITVTMYEHYYNQALTEMKRRDSANEAVWDVLDFENNQIWRELALKIVDEDPTLSEVDHAAGINYPDDLTLENVVTTNLQERIREALEKL
ncbi:hypothetical protein [Yersinia phage fHe-Yen9-04]|uniref:Uncharacterized protein n=1 Tax=Yersinia phage fHe-Yen9-04 TaxID=2052742 RepID=A0A2C9CWU1_9CAUD|nr:hypothetical protein FDJ41_gp003 [Yersinia phage fHe-Yen9-04]SOK58280.1 hypothetical protein [Yersinia phage fHe-Yen9-04]VUE36049.1 hypothetical protein [Yersinia phage fHe-Yen9-04]